MFLPYGHRKKRYLILNLKFIIHLSIFFLNKLKLNHIDLFIKNQVC